MVVRADGTAGAAAVEAVVVWAVGIAVAAAACTAECSVVVRNDLGAAVATVDPAGTASRSPFPLPSLHHAQVSAALSPPGLSPPLVITPPESPA